MILQKIDKVILNKTFSLSRFSKIECLLKANDYDRLKNILIKNNIEIINEYLFINSFRVKIDLKQIERLSNMSQVKFISSVSSVQTLMNVSKKILNVSNTQLSGKGVGIAFIDTGVKNHCDFILGQNRIKFFKDFINDKAFAYDDNGHGTFVCGVCCGNGSLSKGKFSGVAPQSHIVSLKALNSQGEASADKILDAMQWVYDNHKQYNIRIVCMSFGSEPLGYNDPIMAGAEALWREGLVVVAAAGNSGPENQTIKSPGVSSQIITVGGFCDNRFENSEYNENFFEIADFSSRGPAFSRFKPDVVAPSVDIISCGINSDYVTLSGTSVATPMIAGICALILQEASYLKPSEVKKYLISCCKPISLNKNFEGFGYPDFESLIKRKNMK